MAEITNTHEPANGVYAVLTASNCKPILFSTPMVQAILRGEKTQTRRIVIPQPKAEKFSAIIGGYDNIPFMARFYTNGEPNNPLIEDIKLKYKIGDILCVREEHYRLGKWVKNGFSMLGNQKWKFFALTDEVKYCDNPPKDFKISRNKKNSESPFWYKRLARFMPKESCRIFLKITNIRIERLNDITESDAIAEGIERWTEERMKSKPTHYKVYFQNCKSEDLCSYTSCPIDSYETLWQKINGEKSWTENPFVWVYEFERMDTSFALQLFAESQEKRRVKKYDCPNCQGGGCTTCGGSGYLQY